MFGPLVEPFRESSPAVIPEIFNRESKFLLFLWFFLGGYKGGRKAPIIAAYRIELTDEFKKKLAKRLKKPSGRISHKEVLEEFGQD